MSEITIPAKFPGQCKACGFKFPSGTWIKFDPAKRTAVHRECPEPSYDGTEQAAIFNQWVERAQEAEMFADTSPHLSQPDEDMED